MRDVRKFVCSIKITSCFCTKQVVLMTPEKFIRVHVQVEYEWYLCNFSC